ncbi:hypothetical protein CBR_g22053 [Chara braunii]|uniref:Reverse transcriptase domain-containing protein n=1 Tax=Chara braunii TaxID=69332 RepID=A0A388L1W6_CHABU|nr:hypothetical protein CBR_g22053 [Chara braunii]|eukprot:GBG76305.1 hypothetical protein CBR_g22053 [Chara braunii]
MCRLIGYQAKDWQKEAENGDFVEYGTRIALLINRVTDLLATCIAQEEDIHSLDHANQALTKLIQQLEQRPVATSSAGPFDLVDRVNVLEIDVGTLKTETQRLDQQVGSAATPSSAPHESIPKFEGLPILCNASKTEPIPWWRQFELKLDIHHVVNTNRHAYLYSRSGGACQAWLDNVLSAHACTVSELHNFITWADLTAAWKKRFQVEPPEHQAMDKLLTFTQNSMPSGDWISKFQRLASTPKLPMNFDDIKLYFIKRSFPALQNALTQVAKNLHTSEELFNKAAQIIVTNLEAKNIGRSSTSGQGAHQHRSKVVVVAAATPSDPSTSNEAASSDEGDRLAAAQNAFYAPPTSPTEDEVAVGDILEYVSKVAREFRTQRYGDNNALLLNVRIQVGQASCSALLDSGTTRNFISQSFMRRAGFGPQVRRKAHPMTIELADNRMQQLFDRYIEALPVYFATHACEPVTFYVLDTDFDIILGMPWLASADHTVNFHRRTLTVRDPFDAEVPCTIPLPHPSIRCQVVIAKSFRATCAYERTDEIGLCFVRTIAAAESQPTDLSSDPRVVWLLDEFADIFESPTGVVPDRPISHEVILQADAVPPKGCIYRMSEEELTELRTQLDDLLDKGWIRPSSSPYGAPVLFVRKKNKDLHLCIDYRKLNAQTTQDIGNRTIACWMAFIDQLDFFPDYIPGTSNRFTDALSRCLDHCTAVYSTFEIEDDLRDNFIRDYQVDHEFRDKEAIAMDITGSFPKHMTGVDGILMVVDRLTKFAMFLPCRYHAKASELAEVLYAGWIQTKGCPKEIICRLGGSLRRDVPATEVPLDPRIVELLDSFGDVFEAPTGIVPDWPLWHKIIVEDRVVPPRVCIYLMSEKELEVLFTQLDNHIEKGWIRPSCLPYGAPVHFVRKKNKDLWLCIDDCKLDTQTVKNAGPLPRIDELLERLGGTTYFSKLDLKSGYHQIGIHPWNRYKTGGDTPPNTGTRKICCKENDMWTTVLDDDDADDDNDVDDNEYDMGDGKSDDG